MKNLSSLVRSSPNYSGDWSSIAAAEEFNGLIEAVAKATPYHRYEGGLSARCIHCGTKYDPTAEPLDAPKHHAPGCIWLTSWELMDLIRRARE